jgi:hypothetical protein
MAAFLNGSCLINSTGIDPFAVSVFCFVLPFFVILDFGSQWFCILFLKIRICFGFRVSDFGFFLWLRLRRAGLLNL